MEWLNYHHLRYFWSVAREGHVGRAAQAMNVSQPSVSAQLRLLEDAVGEPLFHRKGRRLTLTDTGRTVLDYADDIFALGRELQSVMQRGSGGRRALRLHVGVTDSLPKLVAHRLMEPIYAAEPAIHLIVREGKLDQLLPALATHRLDIVLTDEPAPGNVALRMFSHALGGCAIDLCATRTLAAKWRRRFPQSLHGAPALLPAAQSALRRDLETWFAAAGVRPHLAGEFEDLALMKIASAAGHGFVPVHRVVAEDARQRFGLAPIGPAGACRAEFFAITVERRLKHPGIVAVVENAHARLFPQRRARVKK